MNALQKAAGEKSVLITVGSGGVGKTTIAATLAMRSALENRGSLVLTIDPAKRLANALGLDALGNTEARISDEAFRAAGLTPRAPMHAMMLDMKRSWDELIERRAPPDKRERILNNRFYQALSTALAGSQEYIAMEKLSELRGKRSYPIIVLDTPPTAHALDFLDAPNRILDFLDNDAAKWLLTPALAAGKVGFKLFNLGGGYVAKQIARFTGTETLQQLAEFMLNISSMNDSFRERAQQTRALLEADSTAFVLVTAPMPERIDEAVYFHKLLLENRMNIAAVVVNRVQPGVSGTLRAAIAKAPEPLRAKLEATLVENEFMAAQDAKGVARLRDLCAPTPLILVPRFELDVHDLKGVWETSRYLWGDAHLELGEAAR